MNFLELNEIELNWSKTDTLSNLYPAPPKNSLISQILFHRYYYLRHWKPQSLRHHPILLQCPTRKTGAPLNICYKLITWTYSFLATRQPEVNKAYQLLHTSGTPCFQTNSCSTCTQIGWFLLIFLTNHQEGGVVPFFFKSQIHIGFITSLSDLTQECLLNVSWDISPHYFPEMLASLMPLKYMHDFKKWGFGDGPSLIV